MGDIISALAGRFDSANLCFGHGTDNAWDEAVALVLGVTGLPDHQSTLAQSASIDWLEQIEALAARRINERVPLAYLLRSAAYVGLDFEVAPGLVVPRSPIGPLLFEDAEQWLPQAPARILDLCCGTGCLGIVAGLLFPEAEITLIDMDPKACTVAENNIRRHALTDRARVLEADVRNWVAKGRDESFDLVLFNPPYVDAPTMAELPAEYRHEPAHGLAAGVNGLAVLLPVLDQAHHLLTKNGVFVGEVGRSAPALKRTRAMLPFQWLDADAEGVFLLRSSDLGQLATSI